MDKANAKSQWKDLVANTVLLIVFSGFALLLAEASLAFLGFKTYYAQLGPQKPILELFPEQQAFCEVQTITEAVEKGLMRGPLGELKKTDSIGYQLYDPPNGFKDEKDFQADYSGFKRILVLGDSFTWGASADEGKGYMDLLNQHYQEDSVLFFNTGVGGYGQNNQLAILKRYYDVIRPHLVLLAFYTGNDFFDNLTPVDRFTAFPHLWLNNYEVVTAGGTHRIRKRSEEELLRLYRHSIGCIHSQPSSPSFLKQLVRDKLLYNTRLGTRIYVLLSNLKRDHTPDSTNLDLPPSVKENAGYEITKQLLQQIQAYLEQRHTDFHVLMIPDNHESTESLTKSADHEAAIRLMQELDLPFTDPFDRLTLEDYIEKKPGVTNDHWNNGGHQKMFEVIRDSLGAMFKAP